MAAVADRVRGRARVAPRSAAPQPPAAQAAPPGCHDHRKSPPAKFSGSYDAYALVQAQEALQLTDDQYVRFVSRLKTLQETRRRHQQARNQIVQDLRRLDEPAGCHRDDGAFASG